jgi:hypothetical protein
MGGWVCRLQLLLALANGVILWSAVSDSRLPQPAGPVFISPRKRVAQLYLQALSFLFVASYDSQGYGGGIGHRLHTGL